MNYALWVCGFHCVSVDCTWSWTGFPFLVLFQCSLGDIRASSCWKLPGSAPSSVWSIKVLSIGYVKYLVWVAPMIKSFICVIAEISYWYNIPIKFLFGSVEVCLIPMKYDFKVINHHTGLSRSVPAEIRPLHLFWLSAPAKIGLFCQFWLEHTISAGISNEIFKRERSSILVSCQNGKELTTMNTTPEELEIMQSL